MCRARRRETRNDLAWGINRLRTPGAKGTWPALPDFCDFFFFFLTGETAVLALQEILNIAAIPLTRTCMILQYAIGLHASDKPTSLGYDGWFTGVDFHCTAVVSLFIVPACASRTKTPGNIYIHIAATGTTQAY